MDKMKDANRFVHPDAQEKRKRMNVCLMLSAVLIVFILVTVGMPLDVLAAEATATEPIETGKRIIKNFIFSVQGLITCVALLLLLISGAVWFFAKSTKHTEAGKDWFFKILIGWVVLVLIPTIMSYINVNFLEGKATEALDGLK